MSIFCCPKCGETIDSDYDVEKIFQSPTGEDMCEDCAREEWIDWRDEAGDHAYHLRVGG